MDKRPHPVSVWRYFSRFFFLLAVPVIQAILREPFSKVAWGNLPGLLLIAGLSFFQYDTSGYGIGPRDGGAGEKRPYLRLKSGLFYRRQKILPADCLTSAMIRSTPLLGAFGASQLILDTPAADSKKPSADLYLNRAMLSRWWRRMKKDVHYRYRASQARIFLMAASWSNPASGLVLVGILLDRTGKILGEELSRSLYAAANQSSRLVALGLPPTVAFLGWLLAFGWFAAFVTQFFRYGSFSAGKTPRGILIERGILFRSRQYLKDRAVRAVSVRQTLMMRMLRLSSVYLHTIGSGREKDDRSLLLAAVSEEELEFHLNRIYPMDAECLLTGRHEKKISPPRTALKSFLLLPVCHLLAVVILFLLCRAFAPFFAPLVLFLLVFPLYHTALHIAAWKESFLAVSGKNLVACGYIRDQLFTAVIPRESLQCLVIRQNPFQRVSGRCSLRLCIGTERGACFTLRHFSRKEAEALLGLSG